MAGYSTKILNETENRGYSCREIQDVNKQVFLLLYACYKTNNNINYKEFLKRKEVFKHPQERFGRNEVVIYLEDPDDMGVELIFNESDKRPPISTGAVPDEYAIQGIHHVELWLESFERTAALLTERMNHTLIAERSGRFRYGVEDAPGKFVDLLWIPGTLRGLDRRGMVNHVAFSSPDTTSLLELKEQLESFGMAPTGVRDRNYFRSIYFREPSGILFEIATAEPGFTVDEEPRTFGRVAAATPSIRREEAIPQRVAPLFSV